MTDISLYIHLPFCVKKCSYCDFNSYADADADINAYVDAIVQEIESAELGDALVPTIYFGGGTPTRLDTVQLLRILNACAERFYISSNAEVTIEANPTTAEIFKFTDLYDGGFNRLSIGIQSLEDRLLRVAGRTHTVQEAVDAVAMARKAGFDNLSIDLIFGLPTQTREEWKQTLGKAIALNTEHISIYALTVEPGTDFEHLSNNGKLAVPDEDDECWMFEYGIECLVSAGYEHYEVSNFAKPGRRARHNEVYWRNDPYRGFGAGAVSYIAGKRWTNAKLPREYNRRMFGGESLAVEEEQLDARGTLGETIILGLRMRDGVSMQRLSERFGVDVENLFAETIDDLVSRQLIERNADRIRLTDSGLLLANDVFVRFLPD